MLCKEIPEKKKLKKKTYQKYLVFKAGISVQIMYPSGVVLFSTPLNSLELCPFGTCIYIYSKTCQKNNNPHKVDVQILFFYIDKLYNLSFLKSICFKLAFFCHSSYNGIKNKRLLGSRLPHQIRPYHHKSCQKCMWDDP